MTDLKTLFKSAQKTAWSQGYAITLTLKPSEYRHTPEEQYKRTFRQIFERFQSRKCKLTLVTELTKQYNVHYHGIVHVPMESISSTRPALRIIYDILRTMSFCGKSQIDVITDEVGWERYISKDQSKEHYFQYPIMNSHDIPVNHRRDEYHELQKETLNNNST